MLGAFSSHLEPGSAGLVSPSRETQGWWLLAALSRPHWFPPHDLSVHLTLQRLPNMTISGAKGPPRGCLPSRLQPWCHRQAQLRTILERQAQCWCTNASHALLGMPFPNTVGPLSHAPKVFGAPSPHLSLVTFTLSWSRLSAITRSRVQGL